MFIRMPCLTNWKLPGLTRSATSAALSGEISSPGLTDAACDAYGKAASATKITASEAQSFIANLPQNVKVSRDSSNRAAQNETAPARGHHAGAGGFAALG